MWETAFNESDQPVTQALLHKAILPAWGKGFEKVSAAIAVRLALIAHASPRILLLLIPGASDTTARYVAAGLLVGDFAHRNGGNRIGIRESGPLLNGDLLLITQSVTQSKAAFEDLKLANRHPLGEMWEVAALTKYTKTRYAKPRIYITNPGWIPEQLPKRPFGAVVIDATQPRTMTKLAAVLEGPISKVPIRIVVLPPMEKPFLRDCGYPSNANVWFWDPQAQCDADALVGTRICEESPPRHRTVWVCDDGDDGAAILETAHSRLYKILKQAAGQSVPGLREAWGIYHKLRQLTVPLAQLEQLDGRAWSGSLKHRVDALATINGHGNPVWDANWYGLSAVIVQAYEVFVKREEPAKFWVLAMRVEDWLRSADARPYRIVVSEQQEAILLWSLLESLVDGAKEARVDGLIEITTVNEDARRVSGGQFAHTLLSGVRVTRRRYLDVYPPHDIEVLAYQFEAQMELEVQTRLYHFINNLTDERNRIALLQPLGLKVNPTSQPCPRTAAPRLQCVVGQGRKVHFITLAPVSGALDLDQLADTGGTTALDQYCKLTCNVVPIGNVPFVEVDYKDGTSARYPEDHLLDVFLSMTDQIQRKKVKELHPGWQVVSYVDDRYESLFQRITKAIDDRLPQRDHVAMALWEHAKYVLLQRYGGDKKALVEELETKGLSSHAETVLSWFYENDEGPMAPQRQNEFMVVARASGCFTDETLIERTFVCIQQQRGRHRQVGKALRRLLRAILTGEGYEEALESAHKFDSAIGDVFSAVELLEVGRIRAIG
jgi:hypothetical protein